MELPEIIKKKFMFNVRTTNLRLIMFIGQKVRYKKELLTDEFVKSHGEVCRDHAFLIMGTQVDYLRREILRGYRLNGTMDMVEDEFGRPIDPDHVEILQN